MISKEGLVSFALAATALANSGTAVSQDFGENDSPSL